MKYQVTRMYQHMCKIVKKYVHIFEEEMDQEIE
jgi:hypothetical protein